MGSLALLCLCHFATNHRDLAAKISRRDAESGGYPMAAVAINVCAMLADMVRY